MPLFFCLLIQVKKIGIFLRTFFKLNISHKTQLKVSLHFIKAAVTDDLLKIK
jgi:hypothetical protein